MSGASGGRARAPDAPPACPLCGGCSRHAFTASDLNRAVGDARFDYARCRVCDTYFLSSPPDDLSPYYPQAYYELPGARELDRLAQSQAPIVEMLRELARPAGGEPAEPGGGRAGRGRVREGRAQRRLRGDRYRDGPTRL